MAEEQPRVFTNSGSIREFMQKSTVHGLAEICTTRSRAERFIFVLAFTCCITFMCYGCYQILSQYIDHPVATSYFIEEADQLKLPDVTVCTFNRFDGQYLKRLGFGDEMIKYLQWTFFLVGPLYKFRDFTIAKHRQNASYYEDILDNTLSEANKTFEQLLQEASIGCDQVVQKCLRSNQAAVDCCNESQAIMTNFGQCHRLKGGVQEGSGYGNGLTIMIDLPLEKYSISENMVLNDGIMLKLTEPGKGYEFDAIFLPPGVHALIQLQATYLDFMNDPPNYHCKDHPDPNYAPLLCLSTCMLRPVVQKCQCRYYGSAPENDTLHLPVCRPAQVLNCAYRAIHEKVTDDHDFDSNCKSACKPRCSYWQYHSTVSYSNFPSFTRMYIDNPDIGRDVSKLAEWRNRKLLVEIYYDKLEFRKIKHFPAITTNQFLADIGGQIGLWVGASIMSVIHMGVFMFSLVKSHNPLRTARYGVEKEQGGVSKTENGSGLPPLGEVNTSESAMCLGMRSTTPPLSKTARYRSDGVVENESPIIHKCSIELMQADPIYKIIVC